MLTRRRKRDAFAVEKRPKLTRTFNCETQLLIASFSENEYEILSKFAMVHPFLKDEVKLAWSQLLDHEDGPSDESIDRTGWILSEPLCVSKTKKKKRSCTLAVRSGKEEKEAEGKEENEVKILAAEAGVDFDRLHSLLRCSGKPLTMDGVYGLRLGAMCQVCGVENHITTISIESCAICGDGGFWLCCECDTGNERGDFGTIVNQCAECDRFFHIECDQGCANYVSGGECGRCSGCCSCGCPQCGVKFTPDNVACPDCGACDECHGSIMF